MSDPDHPIPQLGVDLRQSLAASWLHRLVGEVGIDVSQISLSKNPFIIGRADGFNITVTPQDSTPWIKAVSSDQSRQDEIDRLVKRSGDLASVDLRSEEDFGGVVWYRCQLIGEQLNLAEPMSQSRWRETMHLATRVLDWRRLGPGVLLNGAANDAGGPDNITASIIDIAAPQEVRDVA
jgi:hypothetical protein